MSPAITWTLSCKSHSQSVCRLCTPYLLALWWKLARLSTRRQPNSQKVEAALRPLSIGAKVGAWAGIYLDTAFFRVLHSPLRQRP